MPTKKNTQNITVRSAGTGSGTGRPPDHAAKPAGAAAAVWDALIGNPGATAAALVAVSGVSRATVGKTLAALESDGNAVRTRGERAGKQKAPDTWHAASSDTGQHDEQPEQARREPGERAAAGPAGTEAQEQAPAAEDHAASAAKAAAIEQATTVAAAIGTVTGSLHAALEAADLGGALIHLDAIRAAAQNARQILKAGSKGRAARTGNALRSGQLRDLVRDHLASHPDADLSPYEVARAIGGRSSGAVANALDKLVGDGQATVISDHPRRYRHAEPSPATA